MPSQPDNYGWPFPRSPSVSSADRCLRGSRTLIQGVQIDITVTDEEFDIVAEGWRSWAFGSAKSSGRI